MHFPTNKFTIRVNLLNKPDWQKLLSRWPYGLPNYQEVYESMMIAADKNALSKLNKETAYAKSVSIVSGFDYVCLHELGHYFFFTLNHLKNERWFNETIASYFLTCYLQERKISLNLGKTNTAFVPTYKSLEDFDKVYGDVGPQNYDWHQRKFLQLGFSLYKEFNTALIQDVLDNYKPSGKNTDAMTLLKKLAPVQMNAWLAEMK